MAAISQSSKCDEPSKPYIQASVHLFCQCNYEIPGMKNRGIEKKHRKGKDTIEAKERNGKTHIHDRKICLECRNAYNRNINIIEMMKHP